MQWDPDAGTVTLSNAQSLAASKSYPLIHSSNDLPLDVGDEQSLGDTLTINTPSTRLSINTEALAAFHQLDPSHTDDHFLGSPVASSADHGPDLCARRSRRSRPRRYSCFDSLDAELNFDATTAFVDLERIILGDRRRKIHAHHPPIEDEGFFERRRNLRDSDSSIVFVEFALVSSLPLPLLVRHLISTSHSALRSQRPRLRRPTIFMFPVPSATHLLNLGRSWPGSSITSLSPHRPLTRTARRRRYPSSGVDSETGGAGVWKTNHG